MARVEVADDHVVRHTKLGGREKDDEGGAEGCNCEC
jgi:hypothetical protein